MAQQRIQEDQANHFCSICLDEVQDPVVIPCGHSYCMSCMKSHGEEDKKKINSCSECRLAFRSRPAPEKNNALSDLVEDFEKAGLQAAPAEHCYAGPGDVGCDICTGRKLKAVKSCMQCLVSSCEDHLLPHYECPVLKKHKLTNPSKKLQKKICSRRLRSAKDRKEHEKIVEVIKKKKELSVYQQQIQQGIDGRKRDVKMLQQEFEAIGHSADKAVRDSDKMCADMIRLLQKRSDEVKQQVRAQQESKQRQLIELQDKLNQDLEQLKQIESELYQFLQKESQPAHPVDPQ
ncbi:E3 ubiquitin/ISG15 ligase TRIM25-like [Mugil cephalus]|uniref:E3 ubiquitin/ISG15 ligase TRIM25-like n=1 Tax=Mugil cephalus TaxID=48193 RepID=UPI001FB6F5CD|nr:E3 ubiquitin/ISG15 ligase TRIM25-like [Mugil cephalus]